VKFHLASKTFLFAVIAWASFSKICEAQFAQYNSSYGNFACESRVGPGAPFYDFDKIIIYFSELPNEDQMKVVNSDFEKDFSWRSFEDQVENIVRENFKLCLKSKSDLAKPVSILREPLTGDKFDQMLDPHNLVFILSLEYPGYYASAGQRPPQHLILTATVSRAGQGEDGALRSMLRTASFALFPKGATARSLSKQVDDVLRFKLTPAYHG
jgi:hypothetical protein